MNNLKIDDIEYLLQNSHKNGSRPKDFNKYTDTATRQDKISHHLSKVNSVYLEDPYDHINPMDNTHNDTYFLDTYLDYNREDYQEA